MIMSKNARLSLALSGPLDANGAPLRSARAEDMAASTRPAGMRRRNASPNSAENGGEGHVQRLSSSRTVSTSSGSSVKDGRSQHTPPSPSSPKLPPPPAVPPSPSVSSSKHTRSHSRSFFASLKAAKPSSKPQPHARDRQEAPRHHPTARNPDALQDIPEGLQAGMRSRENGQAHGPSLSDHGATSLPVRQQNPLSPTAQRPRVNSRSRMVHEEEHHAVGDAGHHRASPSFAASAVPASPVRGPEAKKSGSKLSNLMKRNLSSQSDIVSDRSKAPSCDEGARASLRDQSAGHRDGSPHGSRSIHNSTDSRSVLTAQKSRDGSLLHSFKHTTAKAKQGIGKASNRFFHHRSGKPLSGPSYRPNEPYEYRIMHLPLEEQTRWTRLARRLEISRDKTEFWLPSLPWRCIDFLNFKAVEMVGIYRVPGSVQEVNRFKQRFDEELDVDLYEVDDLHDVNTIASLLKGWLRELPDEIMPKRMQEELVRKHGRSPEAPEEFKDCISTLPPWNYYLLFAITCHLSLVCGYSDVNQMTPGNLYTCIGTSLKMDGTVFRWLVEDWRNCWKGCATEKEYLQREYEIIDGHDQGTSYDDTDGFTSRSSQDSLSMSTNEGSHGGSQRSDRSDGSRRSQRSHRSSRSNTQLPMLSLASPISPNFPPDRLD